MPTLPNYSIGSTVYFKESAALGFLETAVIDSITQNKHLEWIYTVVLPSSNPSVPAYGGDRKSFQSMGVLYFTESELIGRCEALTLVENYLERQLANIRTLKASSCN